MTYINMPIGTFKDCETLPDTTDAGSDSEDDENNLGFGHRKSKINCDPLYEYNTTQGIKP
jgi:hypothetical protein